MILHRGTVTFRKFHHQRAQVDGREIAARLSRFDLGDSQNRGKQGQDMVELSDRTSDDYLRIGDTLLAAFKMCAEPRKRRAQVVSNIARHLSEIVKQSLNPIEHAIE